MLSLMRVGAVGDLHGARFLEFLSERDEYRNLDLLLLAGDLTEKNNLDEFDLAIKKLRRLTSAKMIAVFGNEEYDESHVEYKKRSEIIFLEDEKIILNIQNKIVKIIGTTGSLDRPTWWQRTHMPEIWRRYQERVAKIYELLERDDSDFLILLMHYGPTYKTLVGEKPDKYQEMASIKYEQVILDKRPDVVFHAHAHRGTRYAELVRLQKRLDQLKGDSKPIPVFNVSLPLNKAITIVELGG